MAGVRLPEASADDVTLVRGNPGMAVLWLDRPAKLNAFRPAAVRALARTVADLDADPACRAVVVAGRGRAFCSGADVDVKDRLMAAERRAFIEDGRALLARFRSSRLVFVAALHGYALGGGLELAMSCDIRLAASDAVLGLPEVTRGHLPGWGGPTLLAALAGRSRALHLLLTGDRVDAATALELGLVDEVTDGDVVAAAVARATRYAQVPPELVSAAKAAVAGTAAP